MLTLFFPSITPTTMRWQLLANTSANISPHTGAVQTVARGGERWAAEMHFLNLKGDDKAVMKAFYSRLLGQTNRFYMGDYSSVSRGTFGGSPVVNGASQTGDSIDVDGCTASVTNWIRAGDMFAIGDELKMAVSDKSTSFSGEVTIDFLPRLRVSPPDNDIIVTTNPVGLFLLESDEMSWTNKPNDLSDFVIRAIEDIA